MFLNAQKHVLQRNVPASTLQQQRFEPRRQYSSPLRLTARRLLQHARDAEQPGDHAAQTRARRRAAPGAQRFPRQPHLRPDDSPAVFAPQRDKSLTSTKIRLRPS